MIICDVRHDQQAQTVSIPPSMFDDNRILFGSSVPPTATGYGHAVGYSFGSRVFQQFHHLAQINTLVKRVLVHRSVLNALTIASNRGEMMTINLNWRASTYFGTSTGAGFGERPLAYLHPQNVEWENESWILYHEGNDTSDPSRMVEIVKNLTGNQAGKSPDTSWQGVIAEWSFANDETSIVEMSPVARAWKDIIGSPVIPYDKQERRRLLAHAYALLAPYVEAHERDVAEKAKRSGQS